MNDTELRIIPSYPLHIMFSGDQKYEVITKDAYRLSWCDLDCALAISLLKEGHLYLTFQPDGLRFLVAYEAPDKNKRIWSPTSNNELAQEIIATHLPEFSGNNIIEGLREIVARELGSQVDCLRLKSS